MSRPVSAMTACWSGSGQHTALLSASISRCRRSGDSAVSSMVISMAGWTITAQAIDPAGTRQFSVGRRGPPRGRFGATIIPGDHANVEGVMSKVVCDISVSADGYVAGPNQTREKPFGDGPVERLHAWMFDTPDENKAELNEIVSAGAFVMGRNMFGPIRGEWDL